MKLTVQIPKKLERYVNSEGYIENLIIADLMPKYRADLERKAVENKRAETENELQEARKNIIIKREDKPAPAENAQFPADYAPPDEGKGEKEPKNKPL